MEYILEYFKDKKIELSNCIVQDLIGKKCEILLMLESPHIDEIKKGYPLAGESGKKVTKFLIKNSNQSFGEYIKKNLATEIYGIVNCFQLPMQNICCYNKNTEKILKTIKTTKECTKQRNTNDVKELDELILKNLNERLEKIINDNNIKLIVSCGQVAKYFINKLKNPEKFRNINFFDMPHPSRNQWNNENTDKLIKQIKERDTYIPDMALLEADKVLVNN